MTDHSTPEPAGRVDGPLSGTLTRRRLLQSGAALGTGAALASGTSSVAAHEVEGVHVLVYSDTEAFRHDNIEYANEQIQTLASRLSRESGTYRCTIEFVGDPDGDVPEFPSTVADLEHWDVVVWNNTTGNPLDADQRAAFEEYVRNGGGYVGIHAAADTHYDWDFYSELVGAQFQAHPEVQEAEVAVTDQVHPSTEHLPSRWSVEDEWYDFGRNPRGDVHVLATLDEDTYDGAEMEDGRADHPIAWCHEVDDGRAWYTGRGHTEAAFDDEDFRIHLARGILWAGDYADGTATGTTWDAYDQVELTTDISAPEAIEVAPDGRLFVVELHGRIFAADPDTGETTTLLNLDVFGDVEDGAHDIAFDPNFADNGYLYLYYAPVDDDLDPAADQPYNVLSRFEVDGDAIDPASEVEFLRVPVQRSNGGQRGGTDFHLGGGVEFGPDGHLYLSTGDNVTPYQSDGYAPLDESTDPNWKDARGTAGDTSDLRGSILRITPNEDGTYSVPDDNMFTEAQGYGDAVDAGTVRPEIYATGLRNPYRFDVDPETGWLYVGEHGPDSVEWDVDRGPPGMVTYNQLREPANLGWPFVRMEYPYVDYDFETGQSGEPFDLEGPVNDSIHNDGLEQLPAVDADPTLFFSPTDWQTFLDPPAGGPWETPDENPHPEVVDTGPIGGPLIRLGEIGTGGLPQYFDGKWLFAGWNAGTLSLASLDDDGDLLDVEPFLPDLGVDSPTDLAIGPDGRLFVADWGEGLEGVNPALYRVDHTPSTEPREVATEFDLDGETGGWIGVAPADVEGVENPTLDVDAGELYRVTWTNVDGLGHNFAIRDEEENVLLSTEIMQIIGETQSVEFTASEEMHHYVCQPHQDLMRGPVSLGSGEERDNAVLDEPSSEVTVAMESDTGFQFDPLVAHVEVGGTVTWVLESGSHDAVAYHPDETGTDRRIPEAADPWNSGLLDTEGAEFSVTFDEIGVYDYRCTPHEESGMVGSVVVGWPDPADEAALSELSSDVPDGAVDVLASIHEDVEQALEEGPDVTLGDLEPQRPDGEDRFYDVDGDGAVGQQDVATFFTSQHRSEWKRPTMFDFSGNGAVTHGDVVELFDYVALN